MATDTSRGGIGLARALPRRETLLVLGALVLAELIAAAWYVALADVAPTLDGLLPLAYPFVWMNVALLAVWRGSPPAASAVRRRVALAVAAGYGLLLAYVGGLVGPGLAFGSLEVGTSLRVATRLPPGYSPALLYLGEYLQLSVTPYKTVGYAALSYLLYVALLDLGPRVRSGGSLAAAGLGLFSCVSCTWPLVAAVLTGAAGVSTGTVTAFTPELWVSTAVFVLTVVLLSWRPGR